MRSQFFSIRALTEAVLNCICRDVLFHCAATWLAEWIIVWKSSCTGVPIIKGLVSVFKVGLDSTAAEKKQSVWLLFMLIIGYYQASSAVRPHSRFYKHVLIPVLMSSQLYCQGLFQVNFCQSKKHLFLGMFDCTEALKQEGVTHTLFSNQLCLPSTQGTWLWFSGL